MRHRVFISHCGADRPVAEDICRRIESRGIRCWIAPRDIPPGETWAQSVIEAIEQSRAFVIILSRHANQSAFVCSEAQNAFSAKLPIFPLRIEAVEATRELKLFVSAAQWTDAFGARSHDAIERFCEAIARKAGREREVTGDTESRADIARVVGPGAEDFRRQWRRMDETRRRHSWCWEAFLGGALWPFYRGIVPFGVALTGLVIMIGLVIAASGGSVLGFLVGWLAAALAAGLFGSRALRQHAEAVVKRGQGASRSISRGPFAAATLAIICAIAMTPSGGRSVAGTQNDSAVMADATPAIATSGDTGPAPSATRSVPRTGIVDPVDEERKRQEEIKTAAAIGYIVGHADGSSDTTPTSDGHGSDNMTSITGNEM